MLFDKIINSNVGDELQDAREILAKAAESSSSESEEEVSATATKRRKIEAPEKPTEDVSSFVQIQSRSSFDCYMFYGFW